MKNPLEDFAIIVTAFSSNIQQLWSITVSRLHLLLHQWHDGVMGTLKLVQIKESVVEKHTTCCVTCYYLLFDSDR